MSAQRLEAAFPMLLVTFACDRPLQLVAWVERNRTNPIAQRLEAAARRVEGNPGAITSDDVAAVDEALRAMDHG